MLVWMSGVTQETIDFFYYALVSVIHLIIWFLYFLYPHFSPFLFLCICGCCAVIDLVILVLVLFRNFFSTFSSNKVNFLGGLFCVVNVVMIYTNRKEEYIVIFESTTFWRCVLE